MQITFDHYLSQRIRLGNSQYISFFILSQIEFMAGFQEIFQAILVRLLAKEWNISISQQAILGVLFFTGIMLGNLTCSILADRLGRKTILIISQSCAILMMIINSFSETYFEAALTIFFYGLLFGISMPISQVMASEIAPLEVRGIFLVLLQFIYILGILYLIVQCYIFLDSLDSGNWRLLLRVNIAAPLICLLCSIFILIDSPRIYICKGNFEEGFELMDQMGKMNNPNYEAITEEEKTAMIEWSSNLNKNVKQNINFSDLIQQPFLKITIFILLIFIFYNMVSCGIIIILPFLLGNANKSFYEMFLAYLVEIPAIFFVLLLFENKKYGGRIKCTIYGKYMAIPSSVLEIIWSGLNALPAESYPTHLRTLGVGTAHGIGKIAGALSSFAILPLFYYSTFLPFYFGALFSLICIIILLFYPIDATQKALDLKLEERSNEEMEDDD